MADLILQNLALVLAANVPGIGHVYDQSDADPTPDTLTLPTDGRPVGIFIDPYQLTYDTDGGSGRAPTFGLGSITNDRSTIQFVLLHAALSTTKAGTAQRLARPFARYSVKDAIRQHNTLNGSVWRAYVASAKAGPFDWGGVTYYATQYTIICDDDRGITPGD